jgi:hypothetical protein
MAGIQTDTNPALDRAKKIAGATPAQLTAARAAYREYAAANRAIDSTPESFEKFLAEWLDCQKVKLDGDVKTYQYERRDYSALYRSGEK